MIYVWLVVAIISAIAEMVLPHFALLFAAGAGAVAGLAAGLGFSWQIQSLIFAVSLLLGLFLLRPRLMRKLQSRHHMPSRSDALIGKRAVVTEEIKGHLGHGRIEIEGQDWAAAHPTPLAAGTTVTIVSADGIVLNVKEG